MKYVVTVKVVTKKKVRVEAVDPKDAERRARLAVLTGGEVVKIETEVVETREEGE